MLKFTSTPEAAALRDEILSGSSTDCGKGFKLNFDLAATDSDSYIAQPPFDAVYTVGCYDLLHDGHATLFRRLRKIGRRVIVGLHDDASIQLLKNKTPIDPTEVRLANVKKHVDQVYTIAGTDPSLFLQCAFGPADEKAIYIRGADMVGFPGRAVVEARMPVRFLPYTEGVSSTVLRKELLRQNSSFEEARLSRGKSLTESECGSVDVSGSSFMSRNEFSSTSLSSFNSSSSDDGSSLDTIVVVGCFNNSDDEALISEAVDCARSSGGKLVVGIHDNASALKILGEEPSLDLESRMSHVLAASTADQVFAITSSDPLVFVRSFLPEERAENVLMLTSDSCTYSATSAGIEIAN